LLRLKRVHPRALIFCPFLTPFYQSTSKSGKILQNFLHSKSWNYLLSGVGVNIYISDARNVYFRYLLQGLLEALSHKFG
jgi:hypothetical protein